MSEGERPLRTRVALVRPAWGLQGGTWMSIPGPRQSFLCRSTFSWAGDTRCGVLSALAGSPVCAPAVSSILQLNPRSNISLTTLSGQSLITAYI